MGRGGLRHRAVSTPSAKSLQKAASGLAHLGVQSPPTGGKEKYTSGRGGSEFLEHPEKATLIKGNSLYGH